jgi:hypothetical protein
MKSRLRRTLLAMPSSVGLGIAKLLGLRLASPAGSLPGASELREPHSMPEPTPPMVPDESPHPGDGDLDGRNNGRNKRIAVRAADDMWSLEFREEFRRDTRFEASLFWREAIILVLIAALLVARATLS